MQGYHLWSLRHHDSRIRLFLHQLLHLPLVARKVLLCLTRVQRFSVNSTERRQDWTRFQQRFPIDLRQHYVVPYPDTHEQSARTLHELIDPLKETIEDPIGAGYLSLHIRIAPYHSYEEIPDQPRSCRS
jgi:hypothetical protein